MIADLANEYRIQMKGQLRPLAGSAFQPTGFPDLGPALFERPLADGGVEDALLVESVQSMANRLEELAWDAEQKRPIDLLAGLPYIAVCDTDGRFLTSSRLEPHRLAGAYVKHSKIDGEDVGAWMIDRLGVQKGIPTDWARLYGGIFSLDPLALLHGVFFSDPDWKDFGNPKIRRVVTAVIEAHDVTPVVSGGVKRDDVNPTEGAGRTSKEGFGFVPFGRTEYVAREIALDVVIDIEQIRGYGLSDAGRDLLIALALWEVATLRERPLRLRTACDLELLDDYTVVRPNGWSLPARADLEAVIRGAIAQLGESEAVTVRYGGK